MGLNSGVTALNAESEKFKQELTNLVSFLEGFTNVTILTNDNLSGKLSIQSLKNLLPENASSMKSDLGALEINVDVSNGQAQDLKIRTLNAVQENIKVANYILSSLDSCRTPEHFANLFKQVEYQGISSPFMERMKTLAAEAKLQEAVQPAVQAAETVVAEPTKEKVEQPDATALENKTDQVEPFENIIEISQLIDTLESIKKDNYQVYKPLMNDLQAILDSKDPDDSKISQANNLVESTLSRVAKTDYIPSIVGLNIANFISEGKEANKEEKSTKLKFNEKVTTSDPKEEAKPLATEDFHGQQVKGLNKEKSKLPSSEELHASPLKTVYLVISPPSKQDQDLAIHAMNKLTINENQYLNGYESVGKAQKNHISTTSNFKSAVEWAKQLQQDFKGKEPVIVCVSLPEVLFEEEFLLDTEKLNELAGKPETKDFLTIKSANLAQNAKPERQSPLERLRELGKKLGEKLSGLSAKLPTFKSIKDRLAKTNVKEAETANLAQNATPMPAAAEVVPPAPPAEIKIEQPAAAAENVEQVAVAAVEPDAVPPPPPAEEKVEQPAAAAAAELDAVPPPPPAAENVEQVAADEPEPAEEKVEQVAVAAVEPDAVPPAPPAAEKVKPVTEEERIQNTIKNALTQRDENGKYEYDLPELIQIGRSFGALVSDSALANGEEFKDFINKSINAEEDTERGNAFRLGYKQGTAKPMGVDEQSKLLAKSTAPNFALEAIDEDISKVPQKGSKRDDLLNNMAQAFTKHATNIMHTIRPVDFSTKKYNETPGLAAINNFNNSMVAEISEKIVFSGSKEEMKTQVQFYFDLAQECRELGNYDSCYAIYTALNKSSASRLIKEITLDPASKKTIEGLDQLFSVSSNQKNYRDEIDRVQKENPEKAFIPVNNLTVKSLFGSHDTSSDVQNKGLKTEAYDADKFKVLAKIINPYINLQTKSKAQELTAADKIFIAKMVQPHLEEEMVNSHSDKVKPRGGDFVSDVMSQSTTERKTLLEKQQANETVGAVPPAPPTAAAQAADDLVAPEIMPPIPKTPLEDVKGEAIDEFPPLPEVPNQAADEPTPYFDEILEGIEQNAQAASPPPQAPPMSAAELEEAINAQVELMTAPSAAEEKAQEPNPAAPPAPAEKTPEQEAADKIDKIINEVASSEKSYLTSLSAFDSLTNEKVDSYYQNATKKEKKSIAPIDETKAQIAGILKVRDAQQSFLKLVSDYAELKNPKPIPNMEQWISALKNAKQATLNFINIYNPNIIVPIQMNVDLKGLEGRNPNFLATTIMPAQRAMRYFMLADALNSAAEKANNPELLTETKLFKDFGLKYAEEANRNPDQAATQNTAANLNGMTGGVGAAEPLSDLPPPKITPLEKLKNLGKQLGEKLSSFSAKLPTFKSFLGLFKKEIKAEATSQPTNQLIAEESSVPEPTVADRLEVLKKAERDQKAVDATIKEVEKILDDIEITDNQPGKDSQPIPAEKSLMQSMDEVEAELKDIEDMLEKAGQPHDETPNENTEAKEEFDMDAFAASMQGETNIDENVLEALESSSDTLSSVEKNQEISLEALDAALSSIENQSTGVEKPQGKAIVHALKNAQSEVKTKPAVENDENAAPNPTKIRPGGG